MIRDLREIDQIQISANARHFEEKREDFSWSHFLHMLFISVQDRSPFNISSVPIQSRKCMETLKFALWMHSEWALIWKYLCHINHLRQRLLIKNASTPGAQCLKEHFPKVPISPLSTHMWCGCAVVQLWSCAHTHMWCGLQGSERFVETCDRKCRILAP